MKYLIELFSGHFLYCIPFLAARFGCPNNVGLVLYGGRSHISGKETLVISPPRPTEATVITSDSGLSCAEYSALRTYPLFLPASPWRSAFGPFVITSPPP